MSVPWFFLLLLPFANRSNSSSSGLIQFGQLYSLTLFSPSRRREWSSRSGLRNRSSVGGDGGGNRPNAPAEMVQVFLNWIVMFRTERAYRSDREEKNQQFTKTSLVTKALRRLFGGHWPITGFLPCRPVTYGTVMDMFRETVCLSSIYPRWLADLID